MWELEQDGPERFLSVTKHEVANRPGRGHTECCGDTDDEAIAGQLLAQVDKVSRRVFDQFDGGDAVTSFDHDGGG